MTATVDASTPRGRLILAIGPHGCPACLNHVASALHRELCVAGTEGDS